MTITNLYNPVGVRVETADISSTLISGLTSHTVESQQNVEREYTDGLPFPTRHTITSREDSIEAESLNVDDVLDLVGTVGQCINTTTEEGVALFLRKKDKCNIQGASGSVHTKYAVKNGLLIPLNLSANHRGNATMSFRAEADADDSGNGIVISHTNALPSFSDTKRRYTLGKINLNGVTVDHVRSIQIAFGINIEKESADSSILSEFSSISEIGTIITITGIDPTIVAAAKIPIGGKALAHANTSFYLRRRGDTLGLDFEDNSATKHTKFTTAGLAMATTLSSGDSKSVTETTLQIYCEYDGTNNPLVVATGSQIT